MADAQYPVTGVQRRILPKFTGAIVTKFDPTPGHREKEQIEDESGDWSNVVGVDNRLQVEVEMVLKPSTAIPAELSTVTFDVTNAVPDFSDWATSGDSSSTLSMLVTSEPKVSAQPGRGLRVSFTAFKNANLPTS